MTDGAEFEWTVESEDIVLPENGQRYWDGDWLTGDEAGFTRLWVTCFQILPAHIDKEVFQRAIALTLNDLPILAARIQMENRLGYASQQPCFSRELYGVAFIAASLRVRRDARSLEELMDKGSFFDKFSFVTNATGAKYPSSLFPSARKPLLILQLTRMSNGQCLIGINISHCIADADGIKKTLKTIDAYCSPNAKGPMRVFSRVRSPQPVTGSLEQLLSGICENMPATHGQRFTTWRLIPHFLGSLLFGHPLKLRVSMKKLQELKAQFNSEGSGSLTANDVLCAILIRGLRPSRPFVQISANMRNGRCRYFPSSNFLGNAFAAVKFRGDSVFSYAEDSLLADAISFHNTVRQKLAEDVLSKYFDYAEYSAMEGTPVHFGSDYVVRNPSQRTLTINSWAVFQRDLYSVTYGTGSTPTGLLFGAIVEGLVQIMPEYQNGDLSASMNISKEEKTRLLTYLSKAGLHHIVYPVDGSVC